MTYLVKGTKINLDNNLKKVEELSSSAVHKKHEAYQKIRLAFGEEIYGSNITIINQNHEKQKIKENDLVKVDFYLKSARIFIGSDFDWILGCLYNLAHEYNEKYIKISHDNYEFLNNFVGYIQKEYKIILKKEQIQKQLFYYIEANSFKKREIYSNLYKNVFLYNTEKKLPHECSIKMVSGYIESFNIKDNIIQDENGKKIYDLYYKLQALKIPSAYHRSSDNKKHRVIINDINDQIIFKFKKRIKKTEDIIKINDTLFARVLSVVEESKKIEQFSLIDNTNEINSNGIILFFD